MNTISVSEDDESGNTQFVCEDLTLADEATLIFAGMAAQTLWKARSKHLAGGGDYEQFFALAKAKSLPDEERDALRDEAYKRANALLLARSAAVEAVAEHLMERGQVDASEFARLMQSP